MRYHNGVTYIVCTNTVHTEIDGKPAMPRFENFIIRTTDIWEGNWSDPVSFNFHGIDPDIFFDDDGRVYIVGSSWNTDPGTINGFEVDVNTGVKLSEEVVVWAGVIKHMPEGPHLYKRNGWYFLMIAEGGTHENHQISIARSRKPLGPYEPCERNPILQPTLNKETDVVFTGHGDLIQDTEGEWWMTCLGVRKIVEGQSVMGRETFLTPVKWTSEDSEDFWPVITQPIKTSMEIPTPISPSARNPSDELHLTSQAGVDWVWIRDADMALYKTDPAEHSVSLQVPFAQPKSGGTISFMGKRQRRLDGEARAVLRRAPLAHQNTLSGLMYYKDEHRYASIAFDSNASTIMFEVVKKAKREPIDRRETVCHLDSVGDAGLHDVELRFLYSELTMEFQYRSRIPVNESGGVSEAPWSSAGIFDTMSMTDHDFTGPCIGLFATQSEASTEAVSTEAVWCEFHDVDLLSK